MEKFLRFIKSVRPKEKKTDTWEVIADQTGIPLGKISCWAHWRKYVFSPNNATLFDTKCLMEIVTFIDKETKERNDKINSLQKTLDKYKK